MEHEPSCPNCSLEFPISLKLSKQNFKNPYDALLLYSRNSITLDASEKLVFVLVALESMLIKDGGEPIQNNLADRMALLIGTSLPHKKSIVATVKRIYAMRSKFIHHGQGLDDVKILEEFLLQAWITFITLINIRNKHTSRAELIEFLDDLKLS